MELPIFWCLKILSTYTDSSQMAICGGFHKKGRKWRAEWVGGQKTSLAILSGENHGWYNIIYYHIMIHFVHCFFFFVRCFPMFSTTEDLKKRMQPLVASRNNRWGKLAVRPAVTTYPVVRREPRSQGYSYSHIFPIFFGEPVGAT